MRIDKENLLESILAGLDALDYIHPEDIPNIDLYMDQVTTFMDTQLDHSKRYADDKILTKTMINNYSKNHLLPPSNKKKYSREHILLLIFIYYLKNILSIRDIDTLIDPLTSRYFSAEDGFSLESIYNEIFQLEMRNMDHMKDDIRQKYEKASETFRQCEEDSREYLQLFSFICELCFDVCLKKQMIEKLIDTLPEPNHKKKS